MNPVVSLPKAAFCAFIGLWGAVMLPILAYAISRPGGMYAIHSDDIHNHQKTANSCYIAAALWGAVTLFMGSQIWCVRVCVVACSRRTTTGQQATRQPVGNLLYVGAHPGPIVNVWYFHVRRRDCRPQRVAHVAAGGCSAGLSRIDATTERRNGPGGSFLYV